MSGEDHGMARITVRVTEEMRQQIYEWAEQLGVRSGHFCSVALTLGARHLAGEHNALNVPKCLGCGRPAPLGAKTDVFDEPRDPFYGLEYWICGLPDCPTGQPRRVQMGVER